MRQHGGARSVAQGGGDVAEPGMVITEEDVDALNRASIARAAAFVRIAGSALVVVGAVGCLAWLWNVIRAQQQVSTSLRFALGGPGAPIEVDLVDRLDLFV